MDGVGDAGGLGAIADKAVARGRRCGLRAIETDHDSTSPPDVSRVVVTQEAITGGEYLSTPVFHVKAGYLPRLVLVRTSTSSLSAHGLAGSFISAFAPPLCLIVRRYPGAAAGYLRYPVSTATSWCSRRCGSRG